jgi:type I restriction enzyme S subunit
MSNKAKILQAPKLRFPEFKNATEWYSTPLNQVAVRTKQKNRDKKITRVLTNSAEFGVLDQRDFFDKDIATQGKLEGYFVVEMGGYVYNPRISATAPVGPISKNRVGTGVMSPLYTVFAFKDRDNDFFNHYFKTAGWHAYMRQASSTGARHDRMAISSAGFMAMPLPVSSPEEQQKIADCLSSLDDLIAAQARKVNALKTHKKGLMQQLFPLKSETQPRLRFPEFQNAEAWKKVELAQLVEFQSGSTPSKEIPEFWIGSIPWVSAKDMKKLFLDETEDHISVAAVRAGARLVPTGTLLMLTRGMTLLKDIPICILQCEMSLNQDVKALRPRDDVDGLFLALMLLSKKQRLLSIVDIAGHGTGKLNTDELKLFKLTLPNIKEQRRIADGLSSINNLINAKTQELDALKTYKKGLMQQLFPSAESVEA